MDEEETNNEVFFYGRYRGPKLLAVTFDKNPVEFSRAAGVT